MSDATDVIASIEAAIERATDTLHNARLWESEGTYDDYIAPALSQARDHITTLTRERDEARRDAAATREMLATAFREGWNCGDWKENCDNVSAREYDWNHSAVKAKADAALTQEDA
jgi:flavin-binding protein dodecin